MFLNAKSFFHCIKKRHPNNLSFEGTPKAEFEEIEMEENGYLNVDRAWHFQNDYWKNIKNKDDYWKNTINKEQDKKETEKKDA